MINPRNIKFFAIIGLFCIAGSAFAVKGGEVVKKEDPAWASTVGLVPVCSATLIADDMALTATHCFALQGESEYVFFGGQLREPTAKRKILNYEVYPGFNQAILKNDLLLLHFAGGLPEGFKIVPLASATEIAQAKNFLNAGYGFDEFRRPGILKKIILPLSKEDFFEHREANRITLQMSSTGGVCQGDSGGPMYIETSGGLKLAALLNFVDKRCAAYAVGTTMPAYAEWIQKSMEKLRKESTSESHAAPEQPSAIR